MLQASDVTIVKLKTARPYGSRTDSWHFSAVVGGLTTGPYTAPGTLAKDELWKVVRRDMCRRYGHDMEGPNGPLAPSACCSRCGKSHDEIGTHRHR